MTARQVNVAAKTRRWGVALVGILIAVVAWKLLRLTPTHELPVAGGLVEKLPGPAKNPLTVIDATNDDSRSGVLATPRWILRILDEQGVPIVGARLVAASDNSDLALGESNVEGVLSVPVPAQRNVLDALVVAAGFMPASVSLLRAELQKDIVLERVTGLSGTVILRGTGKPVANVRVVAYLHDSATSGPLQLPPLDESTALSAHTDSKGEFTLPTLDAGRQYELVAGCLGLLSPKSVRVAGAAQGVQVPVAPAYGVVIHLVTPESASFGVPDNLWPSVRIKHEIEYPGASRPDVPRQLTTLAGMPADIFGLEPEVTFQVLVTDDKRDAIGPCRVSALAPGYADGSTDFMMPRLDLGAGSIVVTLTRTATGMGTLSIVPEGLSADLLAFVRQHGCALQLYLASSGREDHYSINLDSGRPIRVDNVPSGTYQAMIKSPDGLFQFPRQPETKLVTISDGTAILDFDLSTTGMLEFKFPEKIADWEDEEVMAIISDGVSLDKSGRQSLDNARVIFLRRSQPLIPLCTPGIYTIRCPDFGLAAPNRSKTLQVEVIGGNSAVISL